MWGFLFFCLQIKDSVGAQTLDMNFTWAAGYCTGDFGHTPAGQLKVWDDLVNWQKEPVKSQDPKVKVLRAEWPSPLGGTGQYLASDLVPWLVFHEGVCFSLLHVTVQDCHVGVPSCPGTPSQTVRLMGDMIPKC